MIVYSDDDMDGDTLLERTLNAFLANQFIFPVREGVPSDECLSEARDIIKMVRNYDSLKGLE